MTNANFMKDNNDAGEEKILLNNIMSLVQQLLSAEDAEATNQGEPNMQTGEELEPKKPVQMAMNTDTEEEDEDEGQETDKPDFSKMKKAIVDTPADNDDTANDTAEDRIEDVSTDITDEAIEEVAKAILNKVYTAKSKKSVKKSSNDDKLMRVLGEMAKVQKSILDRQSETENAVMNILKGFGLADEVKKAYAPKEEIRKGMNAPADQTAVLEYLAKALGRKEEEKDYSTNMDKVRKTLGDRGILTGMLTKRQ